jgi:prepilin-type N-terminal cleavage/methylation domain-containing protein
MIIKKEKKLFGFTLIESLVVIGVLTILVSMAVVAFYLFQKESDLNNSAEKIINIIRTAQNKTLASEGASQYGVYFEDTASPQQYTLFKGNSFAARNASFDQTHKLSESIEIYGINLSGGKEIVFERVTGATEQPGNVSLRLKTDLTKNKTIYIEELGQVGTTAPSVPVGGRIIDSRHIHFDYSRIIDTNTEILNLVFITKTQQIPLAGNLKDGQIYWEGEILVDGENQKIKIHTHRLNNPDTQFCVHRDGRYNNKELTITLSGDSSGYLLIYSADGLITSSQSMYVTNLNWQ